MESGLRTKCSAEVVADFGIKSLQQIRKAMNTANAKTRSKISRLPSGFFNSERGVVKNVASIKNIPTLVNGVRSNRQPTVVNTAATPNRNVIPLLTKFSFTR